MNHAMIARGLKFRLGRYHFRLWWRGFEYGDNLGGRVRFFPWARWGLGRYK